jgi:hypothetical protein
MVQLTNVTCNFGNMEAYNVEHLWDNGAAHKLPIIFGTRKPTMLNISEAMGQLTNVTYNFGNMEADNVEHL